jgi:hypothetical protein
MRIRRMLLLALVLCAARPVHGQQVYEAPRSRPGWSLERTMRELLRDLPGDVRGYFPTRGEWEWVLSTRYPDGSRRRQVQRFPAAQTDAALDAAGPLCDSFNSGDVIALGTVIYHVGGEWQRWRRVGATRFVPPGRPASFPVFVEWRREDGRWVIAAIGEEGMYQPRLLGRDPGEAERFRRGAPLRLPLADTARVAGGADWFENHVPISVGGYRLVKYGLPRLLNDGDVVRWGTVNGVGVYLEPEAEGPPPVVVYLPVDRAGTFQSYQNTVGNGCAI